MRRQRESASLDVWTIEMSSEELCRGSGKLKIYTRVYRKGKKKRKGRKKPHPRYKPALASPTRPRSSWPWSGVEQLVHECAFM